MSHKYGAEGSKPNDKDYSRHASYCHYHKRDLPYEQFLKEVNKCSPYGPPGCDATGRDATAHRMWVSRHGWIDWTGYEMIRNARKRKHLDDMSPEAIAKRVGANRDKFARLGLLAE